MKQREGFENWLNGFYMNAIRENNSSIASIKRSANYYSSNGNLELAGQTLKGLEKPKNNIEIVKRNKLMPHEEVWKSISNLSLVENIIVDDRFLKIATKKIFLYDNKKRNLGCFEIWIPRNMRFADDVYIDNLTYTSVVPHMNVSADNHRPCLDEYYSIIENAMKTGEIVYLISNLIFFLKHGYSSENPYALYSEFNRYKELKNGKS